MSDDYRVSLDHFAGPMDLLLHLIRKEEVDIHDIPITRICEQFHRHLAVIQDLDLDGAGEFLVMAATLMVVKSRMLLPAEDVDLDEEIDPRFELVQQLLEYKKLKDSSRLLEDRAEVFARMVPRPESARPEPVRAEDRSLEEVSLFDLLESFGRILESLGPEALRRERRVRIDDRPVRAYVQDLRGRLQAERSVLFSDLMSKEKSRPVLIGYFLAVLLLLKQEVVTVAQDGDFGEIRILYKGESEAQAVESDLADDFR